MNEYTRTYICRYVYSCLYDIDIGCSGKIFMMNGMEPISVNTNQTNRYMSSVNQSSKETVTKEATGATISTTIPLQDLLLLLQRMRRKNFAIHSIV